MRYAFFGSPEFAADILERLIDAGFPPLAIVCNPDRPAGRKKIITPPAVKVVAQKKKIRVFQPEKITDIKTELEKLNADFFLVASYAKIIPKEIIALPKFGAIGLHPSLLPRYRGASPIQGAILAGDEVTGVTLYLLDEKLDHGPIIAGEAIKVESSDNYETLMRKLSALGAELAEKVIPDFLASRIKPQAQNESYATSTKKFKTEDAFVDLEKDEPEVILRKIRALTPEPGVWTMQNGKRVKLLEAEIKGGKLELKKIQVEGKKTQLLG